MVKQTILVVDDENDNIEALERIFRSKFTVLKSTSGMEAIKILDHHPAPIAVIITDQRMPEMTGVEFLVESQKTHPDSIRILLTGYADLESIIEAVNSGQIYRYINKPWDPVDLMNTVDRAVERFLMASELREKNIALEKAFKELQTLDQAKNQFMILINHELKTPLTSILNFLDLIKETRMNEEQELSVNRIEKSANRLKDLIDDVLLIVSAETKVLKPKTQPFEADLLEKNISTPVLKLLQQKNQKLKVTWQNQKIIGDPALLSQVLNRIVHNASKFGKDNSTIQISTSLSTPHRKKISVYNEGSQIAPNVIEKIMKPFFLDEDVMNHSLGMGLGLAICQSILKVHASQLNIENKLSGVEVSFEVPCL